LSNPNYVRDDNLIELQVKELYANAYRFYEERNYEEAVNKINDALQNHPGNTLTEKFTLLKILIVGRTQVREEFKKALNGFMEQYPTSELLPYVQNILRNTETITGSTKKN
jgi:outer membrane protein assembly factor BamD (BamD/ComL family)